MKKYIWFLLGLLLSFVIVTPSSAYIHEDPVCGSLWGFSGIGFGASIGDYPVQLYEWNGESAWYLEYKEQLDSSLQTSWCDSRPLDGAGTDGAGPFRWHVYLNATQGTGCVDGTYGAGTQFDAYYYRLRPSSLTCDFMIPDEPAYCSDGIETSATDEEGIDCGGSCTSACSDYCPVGWTNYSGNCYSPETNMINGLCPEGTTLQNNTDQTCGTYTPVVSAGDTFDNTTLDDTSPDWVFNDENSPWVSNISESTVDNGDGTSTTTTTTTTTVNNYDGSVSNNTSVTTTTTNNTTGALVSENTTGTSTEQTPSNYGTSTVEGEYDGSLVEGQDYDSESSFSDMLDSFDGVGGVGTALGDTQMVVSAPVCNVEFGDYEISFCGEPYTSWLATFSTLLIAFAYLSAIYIVFRR